MKENKISGAGNAGRVTVSAGEILYWLFFGSLLTVKGIGLYDGQAVFKLILIFAAGCLLLKVAIETYTVPEVLRMIGVIGLSGAVYLTSGEKGLLLYGMMMAGMKYVDVKRVFTLGMALWGLSFFAVTLSSLFRMGDTVYKVHEKLGMGHIFRWSLGYPHPNVLQVSYIVLAIFVIYYLGDRFRLKHALWLFAGNCLVFLYSVSYTGFAVFMCLLAGRVYLLFRKKLCIVEKLLLWLVFPVCVGLSLVAPVAITGPLFLKLNSLLSSRMELAWRYLKPEYLSLFGLRLSEITTETITMDNSYLSAFITYGAVPFGIICLGTMYMIYRYLKEDKNLETLIIIAIVIGGLTEPFLYNTSFKNLSFIFMGALLFDNRQKEKQGTGRKEGKARKLWKERYLAPVKSLQNRNRQITLDFSGLMGIPEQFRQVTAFGPKKCLAGVLGAGALCLIVNLAVSYPDGYVVYRRDCADLNKEWNYYEEENPAYRDFKKMEAFLPGEEIEYFDGNIVLMEKMRNNILGVVMGYGAGYFACGMTMYWTKRRK